jgi:multiple sugar transport system permease protein
MAKVIKFPSKNSNYKEKRTVRINLESDNAVGYIFISPWLIGFFLITIIPVLASLYFSFTEYDLLSAPIYNGIKNYVEMLTKDQTFWKSLKVTLYFVFTSVPLRLAFALFVAMLLTVKTRMSGIYRTIFYIPSIIGGSIAIAVLWRRLFDARGVINSVLKLVGIDSDISWIGNENTAIWTLIILAVWQFGSSMLIFLAGLKQIPDSYYEAADIDGANALQKFYKITLPMLTPVIFFNMIMQTINGFMSFTQSFVVTEGGPLDSTLFYSLYMYQKSFKYTQMGYGCAMAWVMLVIISIFTLIIFKTSASWVYYESKED